MPSSDVVFLHVAYPGNVTCPPVTTRSGFRQTFRPPQNRASRADQHRYATFGGLSAALGQIRRDFGPFDFSRRGETRFEGVGPAARNVWFRPSPPLRARWGVRVVWGCARGLGVSCMGGSFGTCGGVRVGGGGSPGVGWFALCWGGSCPCVVERA